MHSFGSHQLFLFLGVVLLLSSSCCHAVNYYPEPELVWSKLMGSRTNAGPGNGMVVANGKVFVTSKDGTVSAYTTEKGSDRGVYTPAPPEGEQEEPGWTTDCTSSMTIFGDVLVYAVVDTPPITSVERKESRVIALDTSNDELTLLWEQSLTGDVGFGTPQLDPNDGGIIYLTRTSYAQPPPPTTVPSSSPSTSPSTTPSATPSALPSTTPSTSTPSSTPSLSPTSSPPTVQQVTPPTIGVTVPSAGPARRRRSRNLQRTDIPQEVIGYFTILNAETGKVVLDEPSTTNVLNNQYYGPIGIAGNATYGKYEGGEGNTNDVLVWGSLNDPNDPSGVGERLLYQYPKESTETGETVVLENGDHTTLVAPTLTANGQSLFMILRNDADTKNQVRGWVNKDLDVTFEFEYEMPDDTPPLTHAAILTQDESQLLMGSGTSFIVALNTSDLNEIWKEPTDDNNDDSAVMTTSLLISPDRERLYVALGTTLLVKNATSGKTIDSHPLETTNDVVADMAVSPDGLFLYYAGDTYLRGVRLGDLPNPTDSPTSIAPTVSTQPSGSTMPSESPTKEPTLAPTVRGQTRSPTTRPTPSSPAPSSTEEEGDGGMATEVLIAIIAGGAVGGIVLMGAVLFFWGRRKNKNPRSELASAPSTQQRDYPTGNSGGGYGDDSNNDDAETPSGPPPRRRKQADDGTPSITEQQQQEQQSFQAQQRAAAQQQQQQQQQAAYQQQAQQQRQAPPPQAPPQAAFQQQPPPPQHHQGQPHWATQ
mmetsp:Transcript_8722/g.12619  ORF Transcript_8722/g.12619 Transcript_8722/m.12619 type:complete len:762 (-) Transcript_8722:361-2646(-)